jgi:hypothetical protein
MTKVDTAPAEDSARRRLERDDLVRRAWRESAWLVFVTRAAFVFLAVAAAWLLASSTGPLQSGFFDIWSRWDARHFLQVAEFGYTDPNTDPHATAFFPLFPLAIRALSGFGIAPVVAAMLITTAATIVACAYLYRLADEELGAGAGRRAVLSLLLFPTAVFLVAPYSEALFLAGAIPAFYYARRGRWLLVALPAAVAMGSRAAGMFLLLGLVVEFLRSGDRRAQTIREASLAFAGGVAPLVAYSAYLTAIKGNPFYFFVDQREGWHRGFVGPIQSLLNTWDLTTSPGSPTNWIFTWRVELLAAVIGVGLVVWAMVKREWGYAAFMGSMMAALLTSTWYFSIPRMLLTMFPAVLLLASITRRAGRHEVAIALLAPPAGLGVVVYTQGAWFY